LSPIRYVNPDHSSHRTYVSIRPTRNPEGPAGALPIAVANATIPTTIAA